MILFFRKYYVTPSIVFVLMQITMFSGVLSYCDFNRSSDQKLAVIYMIALISFISGTYFCSRIHNESYTDIRLSKNNTLSRTQSTYIVLMVVVSILLCSLFFLRAGYNVFIQIVQSISGNSTGNYTESRIALNNISGVGYVYQFRVIIFPLLTAFLVSYEENRTVHRIGLCLLPIMLVFLLGTGQRGGFVMFILMWVVALLYLYKTNKSEKIRRFLIIILTVSVVLFAIMTVFNGRVEKGMNLLQAMLKRIFDDNQECAVYAFRYIDSQPTQWGRDWLLSFRDILPGKNDYLQLSYVVFNIMYGSTRGTAPPCIWGSVFYNWSYFGIIFFPFIMGFLYHRLYVSFCKTDITKLHIFIYSAMFVVLGNWIADSPLVLFNQGFITLCLMKFLLIPKVHLIINNHRING